MVRHSGKRHDLTALPRHSAVKVGAENDDSSVFFGVKRPKETPCDPPPKQIADWVLPGWGSPDGDAQFLATRNFTQGEETITVEFTKDRERVAVFEQWKQRREKWVNLNLVGSLTSTAYAIGGGQQAGTAFVGGVSRASLLGGTAGSWVDLHPAASTGSAALAASGGQQAEVVIVGGVQRASLWSGTAASWADLHALLPAEFSSSAARGTSTDGINTTSPATWSEMRGDASKPSFGHSRSPPWFHSSPRSSLVFVVLATMATVTEPTRFPAFTGVSSPSPVSPRRDTSRTRSVGRPPLGPWSS